MDFKELAKDYFEAFGFNLLPLIDKAPKMDWERWQTEIMTLNDIETFNWNRKINGIGAICGIKNLRCLDFDKVKDYQIVKKFVLKLGLSIEYNWVVKSGSGAGYHVWFNCDNDSYLAQVLGGDKSFYVLKLKEHDLCDHIELRWKRCQTVLPKSLHPSGHKYEFVNVRGNGLPSSEPGKVSVGKLIETLKEFCILDKEQEDNEAVNNDEVNKRKRKTRNRNTENNYDKKVVRDAAEFIKGKISNYDDYLRIGFALASIGESGREYFVLIGKDNPSYPNDTERELNKKFDGLLKDYRGDTSLGTFFHITESYGWEKPFIKFWYVDENRKVKINRMGYKRFLESNGFCKYKIDSTNGTGANYIFAKISNNIVEEVECVAVKDFVMDYLKKLPAEEFVPVTKAEVTDSLIKGTNQYFTVPFLEFLDTQKIEFNKDTNDTGYFYYLNGYMEITKDGCVLNDYKNLGKHIWKRQIIQRKYKNTDNRTVFEEFLANVCRGEADRLRALKSAIGYLLHSYKNPSMAKAIIFIDEKMSEGAYGRSGKGVLIKAISNIRNVVSEDGRNFNPSKNFAFQRVKADTNIIAFDDIGKNYPFERLFSIITDGIAIEEKNKGEIFLSFKDSPKIVISTNFSIKGVDDSTIDRQFPIEFSDYYNMNHRPVDDFGKLFFDAWNEKEWNEFDCFMIECLRFYLQRGLVNYERVNINTKKLIDETTVEFSEFSETLELNKEYDKKELYESFKKEYEDFDPAYGTSKLSQGKFTRWLKVFARVKGYEICEGKSGAKRTVELKDKKDLTLNLSP